MEVPHVSQHLAWRLLTSLRSAAAKFLHNSLHHASCDCDCGDGGDDGGGDDDETDGDSGVGDGGGGGVGGDGDGAMVVMTNSTNPLSKAALLHCKLKLRGEKRSNERLTRQSPHVFSSGRQR